MPRKKRERQGNPNGGRKPIFKDAHTTTIQIEQAKWDKLVELAQSKNTAATALIREAVDKTYFPAPEAGTPQS